MTADDLRKPSHPLLVRDLEFDDGELARRARTTLAGADQGVLLSGRERGDRIAPVRVRVFDDEGEVLVLCAPNSPIVHEAGRRRLVSLLLAPTPTLGVQLTLGGRLSPVPSQPRPALAIAQRQARANGETVVALRVDRVSAGCPHAQLQSQLTERRSVPLALYALAEPDLLAANLPRVAAHLNRHHGLQLRRLAARVGRVELGAVAAAWVDSVTGEGAWLSWVDAGGGQQMVLRFAHPATSVPSVLQELHGLLCG